MWLVMTWVILGLTCIVVGCPLWSSSHCGWLHVTIVRRSHGRLSIMVVVIFVLCWSVVMEVTGELPCMSFKHRWSWDGWCQDLRCMHLVVCHCPSLLVIVHRDRLRVVVVVHCACHLSFLASRYCRRSWLWSRRGSPASWSLCGCCRCGRIWSWLQNDKRWLTSVKM